MNPSLIVPVFGLTGLALGVFAGRDLTRMTVRVSEGEAGGSVPWGLARRLGMFLAGLALAARQGPAGLLAVTAGYLAGFIFCVARELIAHGR